MSKLNIEIGNLQQEKIFSFSDCLPSAPKRKIREKGEKNKNQQDVKLQAPDFSTIENLLQTIPNLFLANTLFYSGDFKSVIQDIYKRAAKMENNALLEKKKRDQAVNGDLRFQKFNVVFSPLLPPVAEVRDASSLQLFSAEDKTVLELSGLLLLLAKTESKHLENYSDSFVALYRAATFWLSGEPFCPAFFIAEMMITKCSGNRLFLTTA